MNINGSASLIFMVRDQSSWLTLIQTTELYSGNCILIRKAYIGHPQLFCISTEKKNSTGRVFSRKAGCSGSFPQDGVQLFAARTDSGGNMFRSSFLNSAPAFPSHAFVFKAEIQHVFARDTIGVPVSEYLP